MTTMRNFVEVLRLRCRQKPNAIAFIFLNDEGEETHQWSYADLDKNARQVASSLKYSEGNVLLVYPPGPWFVAALFGCFYARRVAVPTFPPTSKRVIPRLQHIVRDANVSTVLTTNAMAEELAKFTELLPQLKELNWIETDVENSVEKSAKEPEELIINDNELAFLQYTSGSTRDPLGTMITHKNLMANSVVIAEKFMHSEKSVGVIWLPPYHDMGLIGGILQPIFVGFPCVIMSPMTFMMRPLLWLKAISHYRATTSGGPNFAFEHCVRRVATSDCEGLDFSCWQVAFNGAEPISAETIELFSRKFAEFGFKQQAFLPSYGLAEATLCASCDDTKQRPSVIQIDKQLLSSDKIFTKNQGTSLVSCGKAPDEHSCLIVDPVSGELKKANEVGEIWLHGPSVAAGYWNKPELTQKTFEGRLAGESGTFLRTGDLGAMVKDELFVLGRIKDLMIIRGRNYHPTDIETSVASSLENIETNSTAAFTVKKENTEKLVVVQEVKILKRDVEKLDKVISNIRRSIFSSEQLQVETIILVKRRAIPKTLSGKIQRALCQKMFSDNSLLSLRVWCKTEVQQLSEELSETV